ncbi:MAG: M23 family metallopeptidase [Muribaculaceae bacterium]|nr:M23 family metallopeptidase [Muribaculaceae bacterium]
MRRHLKYRIHIENESKLENIFDISISPAVLWSAVAGIVVLFVIIGSLIVMTTPLRTFLPGYLKESERAATEDNILRLDSILEVYEQDRAYIDNVLRVFDTGRIAVDSAAISTDSPALTTDSLLPSSPLERKFIDAMEERERFNISVLAPLAADGMIFSPITEASVFTSPSRTEEKGVVSIAADEDIRSVADGSVLASYYSAGEGGYVVIMQHAKGFVTRLSHLGSPMVSAGDALQTGQIVAMAPKADAKGQRYVEIMMWHNGLPLIPYDYIGGPDVAGIKSTPFEAPRGKF